MSSSAWSRSRTTSASLGTAAPTSASTDSAEVGDASRSRRRPRDQPRARSGSARCPRWCLRWRRRPHPRRPTTPARRAGRTCSAAEPPSSPQAPTTALTKSNVSERDRSPGHGSPSRRRDLADDWTLRTGGTGVIRQPRGRHSPPIASCAVSDRVLAALEKVVSELPGGSARPGQEAMAEAVSKAIVGERHLVVQAGTGTGKTLAYLVPAILSGRRTVVVATATKALQDQLAGKDLPFLAEHLDRPFACAVLKGRSNYLCRQRLDEAMDGEVQLALELEPRPGRRAVRGRAAGAGRVGRDHPDRRPGRARRRASARAWGAVSVGVRRVPRRHEVPEGRGLLRRGRPPRRRRGRRGRGQHPPLRHPPRRRRRRPARPRRGGLRRGPPARGHGLGHLRRSSSRGGRFTALARRASAGIVERPS